MFADNSLSCIMLTWHNQVLQSVMMPLFPLVKISTKMYKIAYLSMIEARNLVTRLLIVSVGKRLTAVEVLQHPWIAKQHHVNVALSRLLQLNILETSSLEALYYFVQFSALLKVSTLAQEALRMLFRQLIELTLMMCNSYNVMLQRMPANKADISRNLVRLKTVLFVNTFLSE